ncbi:hypothetical protein [Dysosmobacter sp.]|nr:hypothetical protein [Dysosmobacter sp.]MDY3985756.1 hypothetical protein [Dysosmobacter sp.]
MAYTIRQLKPEIILIPPAQLAGHRLKSGVGEAVQYESCQNLNGF